MLTQSWILLTLDIIPALFTIVGNSIFFITILKTSSLHTPSNTLLAFLSLSDLMVGVLCQPLFILTLIQPPQPCCTCEMKAYNFTFDAIVWTSFLYIVLITADRLIAVFHPFRYREVASCKKFAFIATSVFAVSILLATAKTLFYKHSRITFLLLEQWLMILALLFILISYILIYRVMLRKNRTALPANSGSEQNSRKTDRNERSKTKTVAFILIAFISCTAPYTAYNIQMYLFYVDKSEFIPGFGIWTNFLFLLNSAINPIIYFMKRSDIRLASKRLILCTAGALDGTGLTNGSCVGTNAVLETQTGV